MFKTSTETANLFTALAAAQADMTGAKLDGSNPHFGSSYATLSSILTAILGPFNKHGLSFVQAPGCGGGEVTVTSRITHKTGEYIESSVSGPVGGRKDIQALGSTITYLRRYAAQSMCGVAFDTDDDGNASCDTPPPRQRARQRRNSQPRTLPARQGPPAMVIPPERLPRMTIPEMQGAASTAGCTLQECTFFLVDNERPAPQDMTPAKQREFFDRWLPNNAERVKGHIRPSDG